MFKKQKLLEIQSWKEEGSKRDAAQARRGRSCIPSEQVEDYTKLMAELRTNFSLPVAPAMPILDAKEVKGFISSLSPRAHEERIADPGYVSAEWFSLVHYPAPIKYA